MSESNTGQEREQQARRTSSARRSVIAAGTVGAVGAAMAIGLTTHAGSATAGSENDDEQAQFVQQGTEQDSRPVLRPSRGDDDDESEDGSRSTQGFGQSQQPNQVAPNGQLATPGGGGPPQAGSKGS